ncbi:hypothetical protein GGR53DRAFT_464388 [Hypoxylon sp. FL1150]|nr:hypothetical protein GGR53DRAFT_464388 [Hypoxylon sp. FL1150]
MAVLSRLTDVPGAAPGSTVASATAPVAPLVTLVTAHSAASTIRPATITHLPRLDRQYHRSQRELEVLAIRPEPAMPIGKLGGLRLTACIGRLSPEAKDPEEKVAEITRDVGKTEGIQVAMDFPVRVCVSRPDEDGSSDVSAGPPLSRLFSHRGAARPVVAQGTAGEDGSRNSTNNPCQHLHQPWPLPVPGAHERCPRHGGSREPPTNAPPAWQKITIGHFSTHDVNSFPCEDGDIAKVANANMCISEKQLLSAWNVHLKNKNSVNEFWDVSSFMPKRTHPSSWR